MGEPARETPLATDGTKLVLVPIADVKIGKRARQDPGSLDDLRASIERVGLLHPIVLAPDRTLLCGERRLLVFKALGRDSIAATIASNLNDVRSALEAEGWENSCRKPLNPCEAVHLGRQLEALERPAADQRMKKGRGPRPCGKLPQGSAGKVRDIVGSLVGLSGSSYAHAKVVMEAAEKNPEAYGALVDRMRATGKVDGAYRALSGCKSRELRKRLPRGGRQLPIFALLDGIIAEVRRPPMEVQIWKIRPQLKELRNLLVAQERAKGRVGGRGKKQ